MKLCQSLQTCLGRSSLPARGAWIEMCRKTLIKAREKSRSPHGERGLKYVRAYKLVLVDRSLPARGAWIEMVKGYGGTPFLRMSLPARGAWIEMAMSDKTLLPYKSLPARGAWIEIRRQRLCTAVALSLPARGAWIEISIIMPPPTPRGRVAPRTGSVD